MTEKTLNGSVDVSVSEDKLAVLLDCEMADRPDELTIADVQDRLEKLKITRLLDKDTLQQKLQECRDTGANLKDFVILEGQPCEPSLDGCIEWARDFLAPGWAVVDDTGRVDYREKASCSVVHSGEIVGKIVPPKEGAPGVDVFSKRILPAKPKQPKFKMGKNVTLNEGTNEITANIDGMIRLTDSTIDIDEVCEYDEINLESGNVRFPGAIIVRKDVDDLVVIEAGGSVRIGGSVSAATITAEGDVDVVYGISGRDKGTITGKGMVSGSYILNTRIEADGGVSVRKEIIHSYIYSRGSVNVEGGRIVGGETVALGEIIVSEAGSDGNVSTLLAAGEDYRLSGKLKAKKRQIEKMEQAHQKIRDNIDPMMERLRLLSAKQREAVTELMAKAGELENTIKDLKKEMEDVSGESKERAIKQIRILRTLFPGVTLRIQGIVRHITKKIKGPLTVKADLEKNELIF